MLRHADGMSASPIVLYAEDDDNDAYFMRRAFAKLGRENSLQTVRHGGLAIDYLLGEGAYADRARHPLPDLLLLDVKMPEMSGLEVLAWVRARAAFNALPVVMFSSSTQASDVAYSRAHGADAYLVKPSNSNQLHLLMEKLFAAVAIDAGRRAGLQVEGNQLATP